MHQPYHLLYEIFHFTTIRKPPLNWLLPLLATSSIPEPEKYFWENSNLYLPDKF
jgi:hypothetical protein